MRIKKIVIIIVIIPTLITGICADNTIPDTLEECIEKGLLNSSTLRAAFSDDESARALLAEMKMQQVPSIVVSAGYTRLSDTGPGEVTLPAPINTTVTITPAITDTFLVNLRVQHPLFTGFRISSGIKRADSMTAISRNAVEKTRQETIHAITLVYWSVVKAKEFVKVLNESIDLSQLHLENVENFYTNGLATKNEVLKVKMRLKEITVKKLEADNMQTLAELRMSILLGLPGGTKYQFSFTNRQKENELDSLDDLLESALSSRPEYAILVNKINAGSAAVTSARSGLYPTVFLQFNYTYARPNQRIFPAVDEFTGTWDLGVFASLDIGNYTRIYNKVTQAEAEVRKSTEELIQTKDAIIFELTSNYIDYTTSLEDISLQEELVQQAEENYKDVKEKFNNGIALSQEVLEGENLLLQARLSYTESVIDSEIALSTLKKSAGVQE